MPRSAANEVNHPDSALSPSLTRNQIRGFWASWGGWTLDGMDSFVYALVLVPSLRELLPRSGIPATKGNVGLYGGLLFAPCSSLAGDLLSFGDRLETSLAACAHARAVTVGVSACALGRANENWPDWQRVSDDAGQLQRRAAGVEVREDQHVSLTLKARVQDHALAGDQRQRGVRLHFAVDFKVGQPLLQQAQGGAHLQRRGGVGRTEVGVEGDERDLRLDAEAAHMVGAGDRRVGDLFRARIVPHVRVGKEIDAGRGDDER